jgi:hypothetical protein
MGYNWLDNGTIEISKIDIPIQSIHAQACAVPLSDKYSLPSIVQS